MRAPPLLIWQLTRRGFGSEVLLMLLARLYAIVNGYDFALASRSSNIARVNGWSDYFEPFCEDIVHPFASEDSVIDTLASWKRRCLRGSAARALGLIRRRRILFSFHVWRSIWTPSFVERRFLLPGFEVPVDAYSALRTLLSDVWKPRAETVAAIRERLRPFDYLGERFVGIHIRRGDKRLEASPIPAEAYARAAEEADPNVQACFVASDSREAVDELAAARPKWTIAALATPQNIGHEQSVFNQGSAVMRHHLVLDLLAEIEILAKASFFVGTFSSNIGVLLALLRGKDTCYGVDGPLKIYRPY